MSLKFRCKDSAKVVKAKENDVENEIFFGISLDLDKFLTLKNAN